MTKQKGFNKISDVLQYAYESLERIKRGEASPEQVRAEAAQLRNVQKLIENRISFAKVAGIIQKGNTSLPDIDLD